MRIATLPNDLDRLQGSLVRASRAAASMERPFLALRPGPVDDGNRQQLRDLHNGALSAEVAMRMADAASARLIESGRLPSGVIDALKGLVGLGSRWLAARSYLQGVLDAGVVPPSTANTLWDAMPELVSVTQERIAAVKAAFEAAHTVEPAFKRWARRT